jgi:hypothetical protein
MSDILQTLLEPGALTSSLFAPGSRYAGAATATYVGSSGQPIVYLRRRFCPPAERFALLREHFVHEGERLDLVTVHYYGDGELFWRICDANNAIDPEELEQVGRIVRITLPEGIPSANQ